MTELNWTKLRVGILLVFVTAVSLMPRIMPDTNQVVNKNMMIEWLNPYYMYEEEEAG